MYFYLNGVQADFILLISQELGIFRVRLQILLMVFSHPMLARVEVQKIRISKFERVTTIEQKLSPEIAKLIRTPNVNGCSSGNSKFCDDSDRNTEQEEIIGGFFP